jgi:SAM-dependent methyltransferase
MPALDYSLVADIYDRFVQTDLDVAFFREELGRVAGHVLELMCGTGRLTLPLLAEGVSMTCVDSSHAMLTQLRSKLTQAGYSPEIVEQDITRLSLSKRFDLVIIPFNSFSEVITTSDQIDALRSIRNHLSENGEIIITLHNPTVRLKRIDGRPHEVGPIHADESGGHFTVTLTEEYDGSTGIVTGVEVFCALDSANRELWRRTIPLSFRLLSLEDLENVARHAGLTIQRVYGDYARFPYVRSDSPFIISVLAQ